MRDSLRTMIDAVLLATTVVAFALFFLLVRGMDQI
jgi:hypothetical protein